MALQSFGTNSSSIGAGVRAPLGTVDSAFVDFGAIVSSSDNAAIAGNGSNHTVNVQGTVMAQIFGVYMGIGGNSTHNQLLIGSSGYVGSFSTSAVIVQAGDSTIDNRGTIWGGGFGIGVSIGGMSGVSTVLNSGTIEASAFGITHIGGADVLIVNNSGLIKSTAFAIVGSFSVEQVTNSGHMTGNIEFSGGNDVYSGAAGHLSGHVVGGAGNDIVIGGADNDWFDGGTENDTLTGNAGNDFLDGGSGIDQMFGGAGNDTYVVDNPGDIVSEAGGSGIDTVLSSITFSLANTARVIGAVEKLTLTGTAANGTGNALANTIIGNGAANILNGGLGNDILIGGAGNDIFVFNTAFNASTNRDVITDFDHVADTFQLENAIFTKLGAGVHALNPLFFHAGAAAADANDYIVYNQATGVLSYDSNGNAAGGAVAFAVLTNKPVLAANDFQVI